MLRFAILSILALGFLTARAGEVLFKDSFAADGLSWKGSVRFVPGDPALEVDGKLVYAGDFRAINQRVRKLDAISVEIWFRPGNLKQEGPARIVTISKDTSNRNLTIGQEADKVAVRLRTTKTGSNGILDLFSPGGSLSTEWVHCVFVFEKDRDSVLYLDGKVAARKRVGGDLSNWDPQFGIAIGDEMSGGRGWKGELASVAILEGALGREEVEARFRAGRDAAAGERPSTDTAPRKHSANEELFERKITTLLAQRCLECHDSATDEGGLDLSRKLPSHFEDGILVAGKAADSLLWESIESDEMPHKRDPLSPEEKRLIRQWIDGGAAWTVDFIDPAIYSRPAEQVPTQSRRLTRREYAATIRDVFGVDLHEEIEAILPPDVRTDGFSNTSYNLTVDLKHVEGYARIGELLGERIDSRAFAKRFSKELNLTDKAMIPLIERMGETVLRAPLTGEETALYRGISTSVASAGGDFEDAIATLVEAMVQSPRFLYRIEDVPRVHSGRSGGDRLASDFELASRLSYTIWGSTPDGELLRLAREGNLNREDAIRSQARRMLKDPRAVAQSLVFASEWLHLDRLSFLQPDPGHFSNWNPELAEMMRAETLAFFEEVAWKRKRPLAALLNESVTFLTPELAGHYGLPRVETTSEGRLAKVDLGDEPSRGGLLTQGSVLTIGGDEASMVTRGLFVLNDLLRGVIQDPPPCVDTTPVASRPGLTQRTVAMERVADKSCGGCHAKFEPLAYGLERFDGLGSFRMKDSFENLLREDGEVLFPGEAEARPFSSVAELMDLLAASPRVSETITWKFTQFAMGRPLNARDAAQVQIIHESAKNGGGTYEALVAALVESRLFRYSFAPESPESD